MSAQCEWCGGPCAKGRRFCSRSHPKKWEWAHNREKRLEAVRAANAARRAPTERRFCLHCGKDLGEVPLHRIEDGRGRFCGEHRYLWGRYKKLHRERKGKIVLCPIPGCDAERYLEPGELLAENYTGLCRRHRGLTEEALSNLEAGRDEVIQREGGMRLQLQRMGLVDPQTAAGATHVVPGNFHAALRRERADDPAKGRPPVTIVEIENHAGATVRRVVSDQLELGRWYEDKFGTRDAHRRLASARSKAKGTTMGRPRKLTEEDPEAAKACELRAKGLGVRAIAEELGLSKSTVARFLQPDCPKS